MPQRRPPTHPLPQGLVWKNAAFGEIGFGQAYAEWAYVTSRFAQGIRESELRRSSPTDQREVAQFWFRANYEPLGPGPWFSFGVQGAGFGQAPFFPENWPASVILGDEFGSLLPDDVRNSLTAEMHAESSAWRERRKGSSQRRRPPNQPLPWGMTWRQATAGMAAGSPLAEWAYTNPTFPLGIRVSDLQTAPEIAQSGTAAFWFRVNHHPLSQGNWSGYNSPDSGYGVAGGYAPAMSSPFDFILAEFEGVLPNQVIERVADGFRAEAAFWVVAFNVPSFIPTDLRALTSASESMLRNELLVLFQYAEQLHKSSEEARHRQGGNSLAILPPGLIVVLQEGKFITEQAGPIDRMQAGQVQRLLQQAPEDIWSGAMKALGTGAVAGTFALATYVYNQGVTVELWSVLHRIAVLFEKWLQVAP